MDKSSFGGLIVAGGGIILGLTMEGGSLAQIMQPTAGLIVFGGTIGAVMLQFPLPVVIEATKRLGSVFFDKSKDPHGTNCRDRGLRQQGPTWRNCVAR